MKRMPVIAIVGRPNVGKSSLLNALVGKRISIVQDMPGVTRDRISTPLLVKGRYVELVDTGGYGFVDPDALTDHIRHQIELAMARADLVLFIVDCIDGITAADQEVATLLRRKGIKTLLVANKADGPKADVALGDFARLGLGTPVGVSALHERNLDQVFDGLVENLDLSNAPTTIPQPEMLLAIVGKRNAGKSTLVNAIAKIYEGDADRVIVSEVPGTTRDSVDVRFEKDGKSLVVIDTAGVRKKRHMVTNDIEFYSFHRAERSIRRADVVMMLIDATEAISEPDKKLASYVAEQEKPMVIIVNKWDLAREALRASRGEGQEARDEDLMEEYREYIDKTMPALNYVPIAFVTAKDSRNVQVALDLAQHLFQQSRIRVPTAQLNQAIRTILDERQPSTASGRRARVYYVTQTDVTPPTIVLFVNNEHYFPEPYRRFILNRLRDLLPYPEVPIKLVVRPRVHGVVGDAEEVSTDSGRAGGSVKGRKSPPRPAANRPAGKPGGGRPAGKPVGGRPAGKGGSSAGGRRQSTTAAQRSRFSRRKKGK